MEIRTDDLHAMLGGTEILHGIDFTAGNRSLVGVIGPNGSGKSTLLKCIYRVLKPSEGAVFVDGQPLSEYRVRDSAKKIAVLAQHNFYNFEFTVQDVVLMGRAPHKRALERDSAADFKIVHEAMERVGVAPLRDRLFSTLSGGEQQRVLLARALAQQTPCLILDEPTNHLDIKYQLELLDLVRSLDRTVIAAIHDLNIAAMYCDTIFVMQSGHIVAAGAPRDVLTRSLIRSVYEVDADVFTDSDGLLRVLFYPQSLV
ncbi:ABC transporter ATP-binding protein [Butyricicoccus pullicaecorum]|uniref:ABC transporter ATP-binding protein n=1 Tax=Butyricicoccus pullicaecorum TaxID=501571 RepID=UPI00399085DC